METLQPILNSPYLISGILVVLLVTAFIIWSTREARRLNTFEELAEELNFSLVEVKDEQTSQAVLAPFADMHVMDTASGREVRQRLIGKMEGFDVQIVDTIIGGWYPAYPKRALSHEQTHTMINIKGENLNLPQFAIVPRFIVAEIYPGRLTKNLYFGPRFARRHRLVTPDETAVRSLLNDEIIAVATHERSLVIECRGDHLIAYRYSEAMSTGKVEPALRHCLHLANVIRSAVEAKA